jgi:hypothetical protein
VFHTNFLNNSIYFTIEIHVGFEVCFHNCKKEERRMVEKKREQIPQFFTASKPILLFSKKEKSSRKHRTPISKKGTKHRKM